MNVVIAVLYVLALVFLFFPLIPVKRNPSSTTDPRNSDTH